MRKLIKAMSFTILVSLFIGSLSFPDQNVEIQVKDVDKTDEKWHSSRDPKPLQFKYFDAIVTDPVGKQYAINASVAGNNYMYEAHAWLANADEWYEIYRATPKMKSAGPDVWTENRRLVYTGDIGSGWQIKAEGKKAAFEVTSTPERPVSQYSVTGSSADFGGYISFRTKVDGKIVIDHQDIRVNGFGYCLHTFGDMGDHTAWRYVGFRDEKLCVTAMNAQFDTDRLNLFVTVDGDMKLTQYEPGKVTWEELSQNTWQISAAGVSRGPASTAHGGSNNKRVDITVRLIKPRPTNEDQPYSRYSVGFLELSRTILYEYLAEIQATVTDPDLNEQIEVRSLGVAMRFDLTK